MESHADRRKYPRIGTEQLISFRPVETEAMTQALSSAKNLSAGGICFEVLGCEFCLGDVLELTFNLGEGTAAAVGRVAWATDLDAFTQEVGIEFIEIDPFALEALEQQELG